MILLGVSMVTLNMLYLILARFMFQLIDLLYLIIQVAWQAWHRIYKEDSNKYESRAAFTLYRKKRSSKMSVSFCNENPNKLSQKLWYHVATGMNSFLSKTHSDIM